MQQYPFLLPAMRLVLLGVWCLGLAACGASNGSSEGVEERGEEGSSIEDSEPDSVSTLEANRILSDTLAQTILGSMFSPQRDLAENGAVGANQQGYVNIRPQAEGAYLALALGVARADRALIERGVRALEFGLPYQKSDGSFEGSSEQDVARFGVYGTRSYNLLANSMYAKSFAGRLDTIFEALLRTDQALLDLLPSHPEIYENTNQVAMLAYAFVVGGQQADDATLRARGEELLRWVLSVQQANGVFPEMGGHDSHYQAVSMMALAHIYLYSDSKDHQRTIRPALEAALEWEKARISSSGRIDDTGNTRTANDPANSPEGKQIDPREVALSLVYMSYLGPEFSQARELSEAIVGRY